MKRFLLVYTYIINKYKFIAAVFGLMLFAFLTVIFSAPFGFEFTKITFIAFAVYLFVVFTWFISKSKEAIKELNI